MIRKRWIIAIALSWLLVGTVGYVIAQSSPSVPYIMGGSYPGAPSYTIWTESSTFFAKDANGQIDFSGTNASEVIEDALATFDKGAPEDNGGSLYIKDGNYTDLTGNFELVDGALVHGDGMTSVLWMGSNDQPLFKIIGYNVKISDLNLQGKKTAGAKTNAHGIWIYSTATISGAWIEDNLITGFNQSGIYISGGGGSYQDTIFIKSNNIYQNGEDGIYMGGTCWESYIQGNSISYNGRHGITISGGGEVSIVGNDIFDNGERGIYAYAATGLDISNNEFSANGYDGVLVESGGLACRSILNGNRLYNNDQEASGAGGLTLLDTLNCTVVGNFADSWDGTQDYGLRELGSSNYNLFVGNIGRGEIAGLIKLGANSIFEHNMNGTV